MLNLRFWLASDIGNVISIIGIIIALISFFVGNKKKDKHIIIFVTLITITAVVLLFVNKIDIKNNYFRIPDVHELTVDSAKFMLIDNGINIDNVIFHSISSNSLSEGVTNVIGVDPTSINIFK